MTLLDQSEYIHRAAQATRTSSRAAIRKRRMEGSAAFMYSPPSALVALAAAISSSSTISCTVTGAALGLQGHIPAILVPFTPKACLPLDAPCLAGSLPTNSAKIQRQLSKPSTEAATAGQQECKGK